jgi:hypothetical protein
VRLEEFLYALKKHPACDFAREIGLRIFPYSIAQHYEMATDRIDLTQDHRVAAFFATNTSTDGVWHPVSYGTGVVYRLHMRPFLRHMPDHLECVGKQALPRPGEQKAWTLRLGLGQDFEGLPMEILMFDHDEQSSRALNEEFDGGRKLFPKDVLTTLAATIRTSSTLCRSVLAAVLDLPEFSHTMRAHGDRKARAWMEEAIGAQDRALIELDTLQMAAAQEAVATMRATFFDDIGLIAVRRVGGDDQAKATEEQWLAAHKAHSQAKVQ